MPRRKKKRSKKYKPEPKPMTEKELSRHYHPGALEALINADPDEPHEELMARLIAIRIAQPWR